ncbi:small acid-soluble spore protein O [Bacillus taeanensis]|uniref:Small acid-soluble spore protein O n=1 Tax=Bacillus taeanensis TaxID=273032 RepID=A0A366XZR0_9BACI|nr:small acid-soluble spore protein O [Bacillus taeanensis]RBW71086.1 small acid-soluble spore protein O [Bacillus taeanensis]
MAKRSTKNSAPEMNPAFGQSKGHQTEFANEPLSAEQRQFNKKTKKRQ